MYSDYLNLEVDEVTESAEVLEALSAQAPTFELDLTALFEPMMQQFQDMLLGILWQIAPYALGIMGAWIVLEFSKNFIHQLIHWQTLRNGRLSRD
jgi:hypothetical protein